MDGLYFRENPPEKDPFLLGLRMAYPATIDQFVEACVPEPDSDPIKRWGRQIIDRASQDAAIALYLTASEIDIRNDLHRITQPTLILHGEADAVVPVAEAYRLVNSLPNAKLVVLKGAGHVPTMTSPLEVAQEITNFFRAET